MKLLLTGFEPFGGSDINPSEQVVKTLAGIEYPDTELITAILPVDREEGPENSIQAVEEYQPEAIICLGEARGRMAINIERVAINLMDYRIKDNAGNLVQDQPVITDGPSAYFCTLPVRQIMAAIQEVGVPSALSLSAGTFLCNQVIYTLLHYLDKNNLAIPAGFIHLPSLPEQVAQERPPKPSMNLDTMIIGIEAAINSIRK
ncbi:MAG: pyroglutamyl-peptidase I [Candidatus Hermodarchaeia archaeon]|jgi:pyroglutamyl-peptidase